MTDFEKTVNYFKDSSEEDWKVAQKLFKSKDYAYCLFFCHLTLEKFLKAMVVIKTQAPAPYSHSLLRLAELAELPVNEHQIAILKAVTRFNIAARYDDEKRKFKKLATEAYTKEYYNLTKDLLTWLKTYLKK